MAALGTKMAPTNAPKKPGPARKSDSDKHQTKQATACGRSAANRFHVDESALFRVANRLLAAFPEPSSNVIDGAFYWECCRRDSVRRVSDVLDSLPTDPDERERELFRRLILDDLTGDFGIPQEWALAVLNYGETIRTTEVVFTSTGVWKRPVPQSGWQVLPRGTDRDGGRTARQCHRAGGDGEGGELKASRPSWQQPRRSIPPLPDDERAIAPRTWDAARRSGQGTHPHARTQPRGSSRPVTRLRPPRRADSPRKR